MQFKLMKPVDVEVQQLWVNLGDLGESLDYQDEIKFGPQTFACLDELLQAYPDLKALDYHNNLTLFLKIDLQTGRVVNWPLGVPFKFYDYKICDSGTYSLMTPTTRKGRSVWEEVGKLDGYVPECLGEGGWGDYLEFEINEQGCIDDWDFDQEDFDEIMGVENEDDD